MGEAPPQEQVQSQQAPYEEQSVQVEATAQRASIGSPGLIVGVVLVGILLLSSLIAVVIWNFSDYDPNDLDGDGVVTGAISAPVDALKRGAKAPLPNHLTQAVSSAL